MTGKMEIIGGADNFWLYTVKEGYDITHPVTHHGPKVYPRMTLETRPYSVVVDPSKTALVIVDLQNYFLSPALGRPWDIAGLEVTEELVYPVIPACRKAGISILWLEWGLTPEDVETMPPAIVHGFSLDNDFEGDKEAPELGTNIGSVDLDDGTKVEAGKALMRDKWNTKTYSKLAELAKPDDMRVWKNRLSGFWGGTEVENVLKARGIRTLIFAGCNMDQCVASSLMDAAQRGCDCLLLSDGTATTSPEFAQQCVELNMGGLGFLLSCEDLADGVRKIELGPTNKE